MKINNSYITFVNTNGTNRYPYYAAYVKDPHLNQYTYLGVYNLTDIVEYAKTHNGLRLKAYGRLSKATRGRDGRYEVTITTKYSTIPNRTTTKCIKNKYDAKRSAYCDIAYGHFVRIIDTETGEVIGHWNDKKEN